ncbi:sigma factor [Oxalicibacterium faecigallinarum]|uniref:sigma factor n=1 Tax=Oxalicibacterium faecigallinarum TaxID=573741 RepID=UPI001668965D
MSISHSTDSIADIYSQHHGWLLRWLRGKLRCADQAADLAQDTFLRLLTTPVEDARTSNDVNWLQYSIPLFLRSSPCPRKQNHAATSGSSGVCRFCWQR